MIGCFVELDSWVQSFLRASSCRCLYRLRISSGELNLLSVLVAFFETFKSQETIKLLSDVVFVSHDCNMTEQNSTLLNKCKETVPGCTQTAYGMFKFNIHIPNTVTSKRKDLKYKLRNCIVCLLYLRMVVCCRRSVSRYQHEQKRRTIRGLLAIATLKMRRG